MIKTSIRNKLILFLLVAAIAPMVTSIFVTYQFTKASVTEGAVKNSSRIIAQGKTNLINYLNSIQQASLSIYTDQKLYNLVQTTEIDYLSEREIYRTLQVMLHSVREIHQIYLYASGGNWSYLINNDIPKRAFGNGPKYQPETMPGKDIYIEPPHASSEYGMYPFPYFSPAAVISMHRTVYHFPTQQKLGTLSIDIKLDLIRNICEELYTIGEEELYILDASGAVIYGPNQAAWGKVLDEQWVRYAAEHTAPRGTFEWNQGDFRGIHIYEKMSTDYMDWTIVKRIPYEQLYKDARQLTWINACVLSFFLIIVITGTVYISIWFTEPIKTLIRAITKIESGQMNVDIDLDRGDEFGILANRFNLMMRNINNLIVREYRLEIANKSNQLKALQAQINPHFLNNALQSIGTLALQHDAPRIYALISSLAKMMRYSMNAKETVVPLHKELEHVKSYLELQKQRFEQQLEVTYHLDESTYPLEVPKMILQPIVENYFKHGFEPSRGPGKLIVASALKEEGDFTYLELSVEDNGKGLSENRLQEVRSGLQDAEDLEEGIGLRNVLSRLQLYYDQSAQLEIKHVHPQGVKVTLRIPRKKDEPR